MFNWIPNIPSINGQAVYDISKRVSKDVYDMAVQGAKATWNLTVDIVSNPKVQKTAIVGAGAVVVVGGSTVGLPLVGFTAAGVKGGSMAALWQSSIGNVVAGSAFANLTSAGAAGMAFSTKALLGLGGGWGSSKLFNPKEDK